MILLDIRIQLFYKRSDFFFIRNFRLTIGEHSQPPGHTISNIVCLGENVTDSGVPTAQPVCNDARQPFYYNIPTWV